MEGLATASLGRKHLSNKKVNSCLECADTEVWGGEHRVGKEVSVTCLKERRTLWTQDFADRTMC